MSRKVYLYVKEHEITKLKYFGRTFRDPYTYIGSGKVWLEHVKEHGRKHVRTLRVWEFENLDDCSAFATTFSRDNNIVLSVEWANLMEENAYSGAGKNNVPWNVGVPQKEATNIKSSRTLREYWSTRVHPAKGKNPWNKNKRNCYSAATRAAWSIARVGNKSKSHTWAFETESGKVVHIYNLKKFCRENKLSIGILTRIGNGLRKDPYMGYYPLSEITSPDSTHI